MDLRPCRPRLDPLPPVSSRPRPPGHLTEVTPAPGGQDHGTEWSMTSALVAVRHSHRRYGPRRLRLPTTDHTAFAPWCSRHVIPARCLTPSSDTVGAMFIGHYGVSLAAKRWAPRLSLGWLFLAVQALDVLFTLFVFAGIERLRIVPG